MMNYRIDFVNGEFFGEGLGGFGGYGSLCKTVAQYFNTNMKSQIKCMLFLISPHRKEILYEHQTKVIPLSQKPFPLKFLDYMSRIKNEKVDVLLSIEFYQTYLYSYFSKPKTPLIIWLQDPRTIEDWREIKTSEYVYQKEVGNVFPETLDKQLKEYYKILKLQSLIFNRKILFVTQARCLVQKGIEKCGDETISDVAFLPNPIEIPREHSTLIKRAKPTILFLGRLDPIKRPWIFFEIAKKMPDYDFWVAGKSHDYEYMRDRIDPYIDFDNLKFLGLVQGPKKEEILSKSWILVNTSIHEALPVSFLEALAYEIPIVSCQDPDDIASRFGIYIGKVLGDGYEAIELYIKAIRRLVEDDQLRYSLGNQGREYVMKYHSFENFEKILIQLVTGLTNQNHRDP